MTNKNYNGNITNILVGSLKSSSPIKYMFIYPIVFVISFMYCSMASFVDINGNNSTVAFALITSILYLFILVALLIDTNRIKRFECTTEVYDSIKATNPILEFVPIRKDTLIKTSCLDATMLYILFFIPVTSIYLTIVDSTFVTSFKAVILIFTIIIVSLLTYNRIKNFKAVPSYSIDESKKQKSGFLSFMKSWLIYFAIYMGIQYLLEFSNNLLVPVKTFFEKLTFLNIFGRPTIGLTLILISVVLTIYFNYFYLVKTKLAEIDTFSSWREL